MAIVWDTNTLPFHSIMFNRRNLSRSGGLTISGIEQVVQSSSDFWEAQATIKIRNRQQIFAYRAYQAQNFGRTGEWLIPVCDAPTTILTGGGGSTAGGGFSSGFSSGFSGGGVATAAGPTVITPVDITGRVNFTAAKGSNAINFRVGAPGFNPAYPTAVVPWAPVPGRFFSIGSRLYLIKTVSNAPPLLAGNFIITFAPKLRFDAPALTTPTMEFGRPACLMRLAQDDIGQLNLDMLRFSDVSLNFVEIPA